MKVREIIFSCALAVAGSLFVLGAARIDTTAGLFAASVVVAGWSWLTLGD